MAIRINRSNTQGSLGIVLLDNDTQVRRGTSEVKTYNVKDTNCPAHIRECWERNK